MRETASVVRLGRLYRTTCRAPRDYAVRAASPLRRHLDEGGASCAGGGEVECDRPDVRGASERCGRLAQSLVARSVALDTGAWTLEPARAGDECVRTAERFTSVHGPRWRMLVIGASEIAHYLAEVAATVDYQVFVCDPREEYRTAWRARGATWIDGMPDDAVLAFRPDGHSVILAVRTSKSRHGAARRLEDRGFSVGAVGSGLPAPRGAPGSRLSTSPPSQVAQRGTVDCRSARTPRPERLAVLADLVPRARHRAGTRCREGQRNALGLT